MSGDMTKTNDQCYSTHHRIQTRAKRDEEEMKRKRGGGRGGIRSEESGGMRIAEG